MKLPLSVMKPYLLMILPVIVLICVLIMLPKHQLSPVREASVAVYANVYQELYPVNTKVLEREDHALSYTITFSTTMSKDSVFAWYDTQYPKHGWVHILLYSAASSEELNRLWDYWVDVCRSLGLRVIFDEERNIYQHIIMLNQSRGC